MTSKWAKGSGGPAGDEAYNLVAHALRGVGFDASEDGTGRGTPIVPLMAFSAKNRGADCSYDLAPTLRGREGGAQFEGPHDAANIRASSGGSSRSYVAGATAVRRLTPRECERLQGMPDDWTLVPRRNGKSAADGPRYSAIGNSFAVNVLRWIGRRIERVESMTREAAA